MVEGCTVHTVAGIQRPNHGGGAKNREAPQAKRSRSILAAMLKPGLLESVGFRSPNSWRFPEMEVPPKSFMVVGFSITIHFGIPTFMEAPIYI